MEPPFFFSEQPESKSVSLTVTIKPSLEAFCATLTTCCDSVATPQELIEDFLLCIEHQYSRPGSWEAALGREFLLSHGYSQEGLY